MASVIRRKDIDLTSMCLDELRKLVSKVERELEVRRFEEGLRKAVHEYQRRDPQVIHL
jgi:hypothetical protein